MIWDCVWLCTEKDESGRATNKYMSLRCFALTFYDSFLRVSGEEQQSANQQKAKVYHAVGISLET